MEHLGCAYLDVLCIRIDLLRDDFLTDAGWRRSALPESYARVFRIYLWNRQLDFR